MFHLRYWIKKKLTSSSYAFVCVSSTMNRIPHGIWCPFLGTEGAYLGSCFGLNLRLEGNAEQGEDHGENSALQPTYVAHDASLKPKVGIAKNDGLKPLLKETKTVTPCPKKSTKKKGRTLPNSKMMKHRQPAQQRRRWWWPPATKWRRKEHPPTWKKRWKQHWPVVNETSAHSK